MSERAYHHGDLANAVLTAVEEIVSERGAADVSLREAARRAGVSHSAPAHHFGDKDGMMRAFAIEGFDRLGEHLTASFDAVQDRPLDEQLSSMGRAYLRFAIEHPAHYEVMMGAKPESPEGSALHIAAERSFLPLALLVSRLGEAGIVDAERGRYTATMLWGMCHGIASLWLEGVLTHFYEDHTYEEMVDAVIDDMTGLVMGSRSGSSGG